MLKYETHPVRDDLLCCCDSFVPVLRGLIPQVPLCFKKGEEPQEHKLPRADSEYDVWTYAKATDL